MVQKSINCPKCSGQEFWQTKNGRLKCKKCRLLFTPKENPFNVPNEILDQIITEFLLEHSTNIILQRVKISKYKLLNILTKLRKIISADIPEIFKKRLSIKNEPNIISKSPVIGIFSQDELIYSKILNIEPTEVKEFIKNPQVVPEEWMKNFAFVYKNYFYRLAPKENPEFDILEIFWGYLKRKFSSRGGIRKEKLPLYLAEYVWRFNHRKSRLEDQKQALLKLITKNY